MILNTASRMSEIKNKETMSKPETEKCHLSHKHIVISSATLKSQKARNDIFYALKITATKTKSSDQVL